MRKNETFGANDQIRMCHNTTHQTVQTQASLFASSIIQRPVQRSISSVLLQSRPVVFQDVVAESPNVLLDARSSQVARDTRLSQLQGNRLGVSDMPNAKPKKPQNCPGQCSQHCLFAALSTVGARVSMETGFLVNDQWHRLETCLGASRGGELKMQRAQLDSTLIQVQHLASQVVQRFAQQFIL